jgi:hypothetical protein
VPELQLPSTDGHQFPDCDRYDASIRSEANSEMSSRGTRRIFYKSHTARLVREATAADIERWPTSARSMKPQPPTWALPASPTTKTAYLERIPDQNVSRPAGKRPPSARRWTEVRLSVTKSLSPVIEVLEDAGSPVPSIVGSVVKCDCGEQQSSPGVLLPSLEHSSRTTESMLARTSLPPLVVASIDALDDPSDLKLESVFSPRPQPKATRIVTQVDAVENTLSRLSFGQDFHNIEDISEDGRFSTTSSATFTSLVVANIISPRTGPCALVPNVVLETSVESDIDDGQQLIRVIRDTEQVLLLLSHSLSLPEVPDADSQLVGSRARAYAAGLHADGTRSANAMFRRLSDALQYASSHHMEDGL